MGPLVGLENKVGNAMELFVTTGLRTGIAVVLSLVVVCPLGMAHSSVTVSDAIWMTTSGTVGTREGVGLSFGTGGLTLYAQTAFKTSTFLGIKLGARYTHGPIRLQIRSSFSQTGFTAAAGTAMLNVQHFSLTGATTVGTKGIKLSRVNASWNIGPFTVREMTLVSAPTAPELFTTVNYVKSFTGGNLVSTTRFAGRNFTSETLAVTTVNNGTELSHTWVVTPTGWETGIATVNHTLGSVHLTGTVSWGLSGVKQGKLQFCVHSHEFQGISAVRFNAEQVVSWSSVVRVTRGTTQWQGVLIAAKTGMHGRLAVSGGSKYVRWGSAFQFTRGGLQRVILGVTVLSGVIDIHGGVTFARNGFSATVRVEGQWHVGT